MESADDSGTSCGADVDSVLSRCRHVRGYKKLNGRLLFLPAALTTIALTLAFALPAAAAPEPAGPGGITDPVLLAVTNALGDGVFSTTDLSSALDPTGATPTQHYGPYASSSTDSGTCGVVDWAQDSFDRHFTVRTSSSGAFTVVEQFKDGNFVTLGAGSEASPGACDTNPLGTVNTGVIGSMHGYFIISNVMTQTSTSPNCDGLNPADSDCSTAIFINTHFTPCYPSSCTVTTFFFDYASGDQGLLFHDWKNASADRGGNGGDIANT